MSSYPLKWQAKKEGRVPLNESKWAEFVLHFLLYDSINAGFKHERVFISTMQIDVNLENNFVVFYSLKVLTDKQRNTVESMAYVRSYVTP